MATIGNAGVYKFGFLAGAAANREDLLDMITNVDPYDTPWVTQAPKTRANHVVHEWLTDTLAAASTAGAVEGDDYSYTATTTPSRVLNVTQIFRKDIGVTETQRAVNPAGFKDAYAYEIQKATKELARNIEKTVFANLTTATGSSAAARQMKTFESFITTNTAVPTATAGDGTHAGQMNANDFNSILQTIYEAGGNPEQAYVSASVKRQVSAFTVTNQNRNIAAVDKKLVAALDMYDSDFGLIQIVLDRWVPQATNTGTATGTSVDISGRIFFLERAKNRLAWLRPMAHTLVGKRGDSVAGIVVGECTLEVLNEKANGVLKSVNNKSAVS